jgi:hypothetical protein
MLIVTVRSKLEQLYGTDGYTSVRSALDHYAESAGAIVFAADDLADCRALGLNPAPGADSGTILLAIRAARRRLGSVVDSLLIAGGDSVVPHFQVSNPVTDRVLDQDTVVFTDNPYGANDETAVEQLSPSLPVGRFVQPDGDRESFVALIDSLTKANSEARRTSGAGGPGAALVVNEDWIDYSQNVAAAMKGPLDWHISPGYEMNAGTLADAGRPILYFNLHGFAGEPEWKGYSKSLRTFVTAVSPDAFVDTYVKGSIAFAECCYGAETRGRSASNSCALKLASQGAAFLGATGLAYGSYLAPGFFLEDADFLARAFFSGLSRGNSVGVSLGNARRAYLFDANENLAAAAWQYKRKTLLQFVLFGDPRWTM